MKIKLKLEMSSKFVIHVHNNIDIASWFPVNNQRYYVIG